MLLSEFPELELSTAGAAEAVDLEVGLHIFGAQMERRTVPIVGAIAVRRARLPARFGQGTEHLVFDRAQFPAVGHFTNEQVEKNRADQHKFIDAKLHAQIREQRFTRTLDDWWRLVAVEPDDLFPLDGPPGLV